VFREEKGMKFCCWWCWQL